MKEMKETLDFGILDYSISSEIATELERAKKLHPNYPTDIYHQLAIMQEEAGEVAKAVLDYKCNKASLNDVREELIQTAAMCVRMLENLPLHD